MRVILFSAFLAAGLSTAEPAQDEIQTLRQQLAEQRAQIEQLQKKIEEQGRVLDRLATASQPPATLAPVEAKTVSGFQFSGDFRLRLDAQLRSGNAVAPPLQNVRGRYRLRMNVDKDLDARFRFHMQLATGALNNPVTNDQDMGGITVKHPLSLSEAWMDFHPNSKVSLRGGRMEEVFADNMRFLWDDDVRFNGFHQIVKLPLAANSLGLTAVEFRAGEYILSNPAVYVLGASSAYTTAGYLPGQKVRDSNLFHPGAVLRGNLGKQWTQQVTGGVELYRNPNQIQLASIASGFGLVVNNIGLVLTGPLSGSGNATTASGGAMFSAPDFQVSHLGYRLERKAVRFGGKEMPAWLDFQVSRNHGAHSLRDAFMASANLGAVRKGGDVRALYQFAIKDANSMISQFTDDDLGTGSGVNVAVHALRLDLGLTRFLQWQNLLFIQQQRRASNPAEQFFVPLGRGANATLRYQGQLAFTF